MYKLLNRDILKSLILSSMVFFLTLGVCAAMDINGSDNSNSGQESFSDLNALIEVSLKNSSINLTCDYVLLNDDFPDGIVIDKPLTINGNSHVIDANSKCRIFDVSASGVVLNDIVFINAKSGGDGGAVCLKSGGQINNCTFENNHALRGGAVFSGYLSAIANSTFISNSAASDGGAVYQCADGYVSACLFTDNSAVNGGAVYLDEAHIRDCDFSNNSAVKGGALYMDGGSAFTSAFRDNHASDSGGAVFQVDSSVYDSSFISNSGEKLGGAVYQLTSRIYDSVFTGNSADHGGAVYQEDDSSVQDSDFDNNHAESGCDSPDHTEDIGESNSTDNPSDDANQNSHAENRSLGVCQNKIITDDGQNSTGNPLGLLVIALFVLMVRVKR